jgi:hypothetical protein
VSSSAALSGRERLPAAGCDCLLPARYRGRCGRLFTRRGQACSQKDTRLPAHARRCDILCPAASIKEDEDEKPYNIDLSAGLASVKDAAANIFGNIFRKKK